MKRFFPISQTVVLLLAVLPLALVFGEQDDPLLIYKTDVSPTIDGLQDDICWENVSWQAIDQVWIPYGTNHNDTDFRGRYKITWSEEANLLYFLVEVEDDELVDGFVSGQTAAVHHFDIIEVFLDENFSGGDHIFDDGDSNAENAFAYHLYADFPESGSTSPLSWVHDQDGEGWSTLINRNYAGHFPEFVLTRGGNRLIYEFSLIVYTDEYEYEQPAGTRSQLSAGKEMGLSLAYCDNDDPDEQPKQRDSFFGSVWVPEEEHNNHWMNADGFGFARLVDSLATSIQDDERESRKGVDIDLYPNPGISSVRITLDGEINGNLRLRMYNLLGEVVLNETGWKRSYSYQTVVNLARLPRGLYFVEILVDNKFVYRHKLTLSGF